LCPKIFYDENTLKKHVDSVHLKLKKFACEFCSLTSNYEAKVKVHIEAVHLKIKK